LIEDENTVHWLYNDGDVPQYMWDTHSGIVQHSITAGKDPQGKESQEGISRLLFDLGRKQPSLLKI
jgi:23S rRNA A2030 N6-methylase RlmJ